MNSKYDKSIKTPLLEGKLISDSFVLASSQKIIYFILIFGKRFMCMCSNHSNELISIVPIVFFCVISNKKCIIFSIFLTGLGGLYL